MAATSLWISHFLSFHFSAIFTVCKLTLYPFSASETDSRSSSGVRLKQLDALQLSSLPPQCAKTDSCFPDETQHNSLLIRCGTKLGLLWDFYNPYQNDIISCKWGLLYIILPSKVFCQTRFYKYYKTSGKAATQSFHLFINKQKSWVHSSSHVSFCFFYFSGSYSLTMH